MRLMNPGRRFLVCFESHDGPFVFGTVRAPLTTIVATLRHRQTQVA
jgi:hypothetical protein